MSTVLSVDPGFKNFAFALVREGHVMATQKADIGWEGRTESGKHLKRTAENISELFDGFLETDIDEVLVERQSQGPPFPQLEGIIIALAAVNWPNANIIKIEPQAVARWLPTRFKSREAKKKWTKEKVTKHFGIDPDKISIDECDALLNYLYFSKIKLE